MENLDTLIPKKNENIRVMGLLLILGVLIPYIGGWLLVLCYYLFKKDSFNTQEHEVFWEIMNFNLSFCIYGAIAAFLIFALIGFLLFPLVVLTYFILLVLSVIEYVAGKPYKYPWIVRFI